jgi:hypothetical protein
MIRLVYPKKTSRDVDLVYFTVNQLVSELEPEKDLVITSSEEFLETCKTFATFRSDLQTRCKHFLNFSQTNSIVHSKQIDLEKISDRQYRNIILINFDSMDPTILRCLVNTSKKTEIIGISNEHTDYLRDLQLEIYEHKYNGFTDDQIIVMMVLKYNCPQIMISEILNSVKFQHSNIGLRTIEHISDIIPFIKH